MSSYSHSLTHGGILRCFWNTCYNKQSFLPRFLIFTNQFLRQQLPPAVLSLTCCSYSVSKPQPVKVCAQLVCQACRIKTNMTTCPPNATRGSVGQIHWLMWFFSQTANQPDRNVPFSSIQLVLEHLDHFWGWIRIHYTFNTIYIQMK